MDVFVSVLDNYPIQSGFLMIGLGIIYLVFRLDNQNKENYKSKNIMGKVSVINSWRIITVLIIKGL